MSFTEYKPSRSPNVKGLVADRRDVIHRMPTGAFGGIVRRIGANIFDFRRTVWFGEETTTTTILLRQRLRRTNERKAKWQIQ